jgi:hypothetical protein
MPRKVTAASAKEKWNFYFPKLLKAQMHLKLLEVDKRGQQSALLRALITLFVEGKLDNQLPHLKKLIDDETYITEHNKQSKL